MLNTRDDTDRVALADQLRHQAFHDPLTGLPNRALLSDRATQALARSRRTMASVAVMAIRRALESREFWLLYQPQFDAERERLEGFEALVRWNHPKHGLMRPERFVPLAEETGLIVPLGRWVLGEALQQAAGWERVAGGSGPLTISVNVSAVQLGAPSLIPDVEEALHRSGIDPCHVVLEITESALIDSSPRVLDTLGAIKELGVRLAIDDFGTGYASLAYLQSMPIDILKVDRSFVASSGDGERGQELLEAIVKIGHVLSLVTVAEGVEQPGQLARVKDAGCDVVQGFLLGQPLSQEEAQRLIVAHSEPRLAPRR